MRVQDGYKSLYRCLDSANREIRLLRLTRPPTISQRIQNSILPILDLTRLDSTESKSSLICSIVTVRLSQAPQYHALSYTWGDGKPTYGLKVDREWLPIRRNLIAGLQAMCSHELWEEYFWVDAICINQDDDDEKNTQVPIMHKIYNGAEMVCVWLGEELASTPRAFEYILSMRESLNTDADREAVRELFQNPYWSRVWVLQEIAHARKAVFVCGAQVVSLKALRAASVSWKKASIAALGGSSQFDTGIRPFFLFREHVFRSHPPAMSHSGRRASALDSEREMYKLMQPEYEDVFRLFVDTRQYVASDRRDKLYALLNLMPAEHVFLEPDYQCSEAALYLRVIKQAIAFMKSLWCISLGGVGVFKGSRSFGLPSWVPDFPKIGDKHSPYPTPVTMLGHKSGGVFRASGSREPRYRFLPQNRLSAKGYVCDRIDALVPPAGNLDSFLQDICKSLRTFDVEYGSDTSVYGRLFRALIPVALKAEMEPLLSQYPLGQFYQKRWVELASALTMLVGNVSVQQLKDEHGHAREETATLASDESGEPTEPVRRMLARRDPALGYALLTHIGTKALINDQPLRDKLYQDALRAFGENMAKYYGLPGNMLIPYNHKFEVYCNSVATAHGRLLVELREYWSENRAFVVTESGRMGFVQQGTKKGDKICILHGCPVPLVIREDGQDHVLVGDCYVEGMMAGEMVEEHEKGKFQLDCITLR